MYLTTIYQYRYLGQEKSTDSVDAVCLHGDSQSLGHKHVFQFPQEPPMFPTHPPLKPRQIELRQPQMKFTPGAGTGKVFVPQTDSPFPAPYLLGHGPGMQTPFSEVPIQRQPRAHTIGHRSGSIQVATAMMQRKKRTSRTQGKGVRQDSLPKPATTVTDIDVGTVATDADERESKVTFDKEEEEKIKKRQAQGRQMSLPVSTANERGRKRVFSTSGKRMSPIGGYEGAESTGKRRRQRLMHRARTVGSSPSRQPALDPDKLRRCQTPECVLADERSLKPRKGKKGLALRKCKTPDTIMMRSRSKREGEFAKRFSESPETEGSSNVSSSPGGKSAGQLEPEDDTAETTTVSQGDSSLVTKIISADTTTTTTGHIRRRWGPRREKSRKEPSSPHEIPKKKVPAHISSSSSSYLLSGPVAAASASEGAADVESTTHTDPPYIYFSLYFDIQRRALTVNLIKAENLPPKPANQGSCDPFVMMFLLPNKQEVLQSVVKHRTLNPEFQQVFEFGGILANDLKNQVLVFRVFDHDRCVYDCV